MTGGHTRTRQELIALGRTVVRERLEKLGCTVTPPSSRTGGPLEVETPSATRSRCSSPHSAWAATSSGPRGAFSRPAIGSPRSCCWETLSIHTSTWCPARSGARRRLHLPTETTSASAASPSTASRWLVHLSQRLSDTPGTSRRAPTIFARPPRASWGMRVFRGSSKPTRVVPVIGAPPSYFRSRPPTANIPHSSARFDRRGAAPMSDAGRYWGFGGSPKRPTEGSRPAGR